MYAVELTNVSKIFKGQNQREYRAVVDVNLAIKEGEFFSLLGPSGCGKTTLLRMIAGFENPSEGKIMIKGETMGDRPPFHRPVNTVFQQYALFPHLTVAENVAFGLEMDGVSRPEIKTRVDEALGLVKLNGFENRRPRQLSGGQQQRVALARAMVKKPQVLLFDEPLGALDLKLRKEMQLELKQMQQQLGITFVYVTHDQEEALTMSDRIAVMQSGKVLQVGSPTAIYETPQCRFVADFIGESNFLVGRVVQQQNSGAIVLVDEHLYIAVPYQSRLPIGKVVTLVIRPEQAILLPQNNPSQSGWVGVLENIVYLGTDIRFVVRLTPTSSLVVRRQNIQRSPLDSFRIGEKVQVRVAPDSISLLEEGVLTVEPRATKPPKPPTSDHQKLSSVLEEFDRGTANFPPFV